MSTVLTPDVFEAIRTRRSVRTFQPTPILAPVVEHLVDAARWAPSPSNLQTWRFIAVQNPAALATLKALSPGFPRQATTAIVICSDRRDVHGCEEEFARVIVIEEAAMAAQNLLLAAHALGVGACAVASFSPRGIAELIELPDPIWPILIIALGIPNSQPDAPQRRPVETILSWETYKEA